MELIDYYSIIDNGNHDEFFKKFSPMESTLKSRYGSDLLIMALDRMIDLPENERIAAFKQLVMELRTLEPHNTMGQ